MSMLAQALQRLQKEAFVPPQQPGGEVPIAPPQPMDPNMMPPPGGDPGMMPPGAEGMMPPGGDPMAGMQMDPATGMPIDPATGMPMDPAMMQQMMGGMPPGGDPGMMPPGADPNAMPPVMVTFEDLQAILQEALEAGGGGGKKDKDKSEVEALTERIAGVEDMLSQLLNITSGGMPPGAPPMGPEAGMPPMDPNMGMMPPMGPEAGMPPMDPNMGMMPPKEAAAKPSTRELYSQEQLKTRPAMIQRLRKLRGMA